MPRKGWTSVAIPNEVYMVAKKYYEEHKEQLKLVYGVRSFTSFITLCVREYCKKLGAIREEGLIKAEVREES